MMSTPAKSPPVLIGILDLLRTVISLLPTLNDLSPRRPVVRSYRLLPVPECEVTLVDEVPRGVLQHVQSTENIRNLPSGERNPDSPRIVAYPDRYPMNEYFEVSPQPAQEAPRPMFDIHAEKPCHARREEGDISACVEEYAELEEHAVSGLQRDLPNGLGYCAEDFRLGLCERVFLFRTRTIACLVGTCPRKIRPFGYTRLALS